MFLFNYYMLVRMDIELLNIEIIAYLGTRLAQVTESGW